MSSLFIFQSFDIQFDEYQSESQFSRQAQDIIDQLDRCGFSQTRADGVHEAVIPSQYNSLARDARIVIRKSDGTTLYITST
jgi:arginyl-tRNA synthetase